jgi:NAD+ kinase
MAVDVLSSPARKVGITFNPQQRSARDLAMSLQSAIQARGLGVWVEDGATQEEMRAELADTDLLICLGGDGTVLRAVRLVGELETPIFGINMGRLGFLTEVDGPEAIDRLDEVLRGGARIEQRTMLAASLSNTGERFVGLNEATVGRATLSRAIQLAVDVDGIRIADYRCDGVIVATATGSTAYSLSVGGPILPPESDNLVIVPVAPHLAAQHALVLPGNETVHICLEPGQQAVVSVDGAADSPLSEGDSVLVTAADHHARFLRLNPRSDFYIRMAAQLGWHRPGGNARPLPAASLEPVE